MAKKNVFRSILLGIERTIKGYSLRDVADSAADRIRKRTRLGYGVQDGKRGNPREKLKELSEEYVKYRRGRINRAVARPKKSNLSFTGKLLDALYGKVINGKAVVQVKENRKDGVKNRDIIKGQAEQGRHFFELTDKEVKGLRSEIKKDLIKALRKRK